MKTTFTFTNLDTVITARNEREKSFARIFITQLNTAVEYMQDKEYRLGQRLKNDTSANWFWEDLGGQASALYFMEMIPKPISSNEIARACKQAYNETASAEDKIPEYLL